MREYFTLRDVINGELEISTTSIFPLDIGNGEKRNSSMPTFLYYAVCAKVLRELPAAKRKPSLYDVKNKDYSHIAMTQFKDTVKQRLNTESELSQSVLLEHNDTSKGAYSKLIQARLIHWILNFEREMYYQEYLERDKETINCGKSAPMMTLPSPLMIPLSFFFGTDSNARKYAIMVAKKHYPNFTNKNSETRTWSRTVHQLIIADLITWHRTPEEILRDVPSLLDTPLPAFLLK